MKDIASALARVARGFPFPERITGAQRAKVLRVAAELARLVPPPAIVADLGTGMALIPGLLAEMGYEALGVDDYGDPWHTEEAITDLRKFAELVGFTLLHAPIEAVDMSLDVAVLVDVIEHLHDSPRLLLNHVGQIIKSGGFVIVVMPNSVNLRKRFDVARGRTNYPPLDQFFYSAAPWRGHVREYTPHETGRLLRLMGFDLLHVNTFDAILYDRLGGLRGRAFRAVSHLMPGMKDSVIAIGRRPEGWRPVEAWTESVDPDHAL